MDAVTPVIRASVLMDDHDYSPTRTEMARTFAVSSQKGGVGKTTTASNLAAVWSEGGVRVLAVDFDPQFALTRSFGWAPSDAPATAMDVIAGHSELGAAA